MIDIIISGGGLQKEVTLRTSLLRLDQGIGVAFNIVEIYGLRDRGEVLSDSEVDNEAERALIFYLEKGKSTTLATIKELLFSYGLDGLLRNEEQEYDRLVRPF